MWLSRQEKGVGTDEQTLIFRLVNINLLYNITKVA